MLSAPEHEPEPAVAEPGSAPPRRRLIGLCLLGTVVLLAIYAGFLVPLLQRGLAGDSGVTPGDPVSVAADMSTADVFAWVPPPLVGVAHVVAMWAIALGPVLSAVGVGVGAYHASREAAARRWVLAIASGLTFVGCVVAFALALSPWGRAARLILFD